MNVKIVFDQSSTANVDVEKTVNEFLNKIETLEISQGNKIIIHQDGVEKSYYIRCCLLGKKAAPLTDLNARLIPESSDSFRANRGLLTKNKTFQRMSQDAVSGREFNDIIVEYNNSYSPENPLKVWGGQHRSKAIQLALEKGTSKYHGFRVYFCLTKEQRSALALVSNTNINVSNDLFDRQLEETLIGPHLRKWCERVGLLAENEDFPDAKSHAERVTTQLARTFVVNFFLGKERRSKLSAEELDKNFYEPYLCQSGSGVLDEQYSAIVKSRGVDLWKDKGLEEAGKAFAQLTKAQSESIRESKINRKGFRTKALTLSVLPAWAYVAGLLQLDPSRLMVHLSVPKAAKGAPDPLNAEEMSQYKHTEDPPTYRGLGNRSSMMDRQRMAQVFLARSLNSEATFDRKLIDKGVSTLRGLKNLSVGYTS
ncbi:MAG: hypothetical protein HYX79_08765 [Chloroflexi bacterium]|nr:hypothetical protein [Chloroflexota bacterium]